MQIQLIRKSYEKLRPISRDVVNAFCRYLLEDNPELGQIFQSNKLTKNQQQIITSLSYVVDHLDKHEKINEFIFTASNHFSDIPLSERHLKWIKRCLLKSYASYLGPQRWTSDVEKSWIRLFDYCIDQFMKSRAVTPPKKSEDPQRPEPPIPQSITIADNELPRSGMDIKPDLNDSLNLKKTDSEPPNSNIFPPFSLDTKDNEAKDEAKEAEASIPPVSTIPPASISGELKESKNTNVEKDDSTKNNHNETASETEDKRVNVIETNQKSPEHEDKDVNDLDSKIRAIDVKKKESAPVKPEEENSMSSEKELIKMAVKQTMAYELPKSMKEKIRAKINEQIKATILKEVEAIYKEEMENITNSDFIETCIKKVS